MISVRRDVQNCNLNCRPYVIVDLCLCAALAGLPGCIKNRSGKVNQYK